MKTIQNLGLGLFVIALFIFTAMLGLGGNKINTSDLPIENEYHRKAIAQALVDEGLDLQDIPGILAISKVKSAIKVAQGNLDNQAKISLPDGVDEWTYRMGDGWIKGYVSKIIKQSASGPVHDRPWLFFLLTFGLSILGGLMYILPKFTEHEGIKHNGIYHSSLTKGLRLGVRSVFLAIAMVGTLVWGYHYMGGQYFWPLVTLVVGVLIVYLVMKVERSGQHNPQRNAGPDRTGMLGVFAGIYLIGFYILLYWAPSYINNWVVMVSPISKMLSGGEASQWFLYGLMYTVIVIVMGVRMLSKYQHNRYQQVRTLSVMFFQTSFAFLIPEILVRFNKPWYDFKNIWPLDYDFFFDWNLQSLMSNGNLGLFMLVWGLTLMIIGVPVFVYFFGKRWYCSWVCGCGGLAETMGDPFRQLSDKSLRAWKYERYIIHGVLVFAVLMTLMVLYTYFTGSRQILFFNSDTVRTWYGFFVGSAFAGVVGTGFYPLMGNRVWCRFGCPLAAYLGLVQRFKSRFRITTNGGQCISCGNCSTYCEMGIDVRAYAQRGQDIVRSSCVGCGVCSAVCPRGVLRLENGPDTGSSRTASLRTIHIAESEVKILS